MHRLIDFKSFADVSVNLFRPMTVLIGPNGSGKTNLIEAVELLAFLASGEPLHNVTDVGRGGGLEIRGGLQSCVRRGAEQFSLGFRAQFRFDGAPARVNYEIAIGGEPTPSIRRERLQVGDREWFSATARESHLDVTYDNFNRGPNNPTTTALATTSVLSQYPSIAIKNKRLKDCASIVDGIRRHLRRAYVFDPSPRLMRGYERIGNDVLRRDGANLSAVLYDLWTDDKHRATLEHITNLIRQVPEEPFAEFGFETTRLNDVIFGVRTEPGGPLLDARLLSDGTLRALAVLTALETCEPHSRVIIEEFDNGVHPTRVAMLCNALAEAATRRKLNVLVTTHNPATLDALPHEQLAGVLICHWKQVEKVAAVTPLLELPRADELLEQGRLGDLVTRRVVETYLAPESDEERDANVERWLRSLP